jgi:hypothetical protein
VERDQRPVIAVAARVSELQSDEQAIIAAKRRAVRFSADAQHSLQVARGGRRDQQLPGVRPAFFHNGGGLSPDKFGAAGAEALVTAVGQFVGPAIQSTIASLHRLNAECIARSQRSNSHRAEERTQVLAEAQGETQPIALGFNVCQRAELEIMGHAPILHNLAAALALRGASTAAKLLLLAACGAAERHVELAQERDEHRRHREPE